MRHTRKILAVGVTALIIGIVVWIVGMSIIGWDFTRLDSTEYTAQSYACTDEVKSISVSLSSFPLTVKKGDSMSLDYYEADNSEVFVEEKDGVLSVVENYKYKPFKSGLFNVGRSTHKYTLTVSSCATIEIKGVNSDVTFDGVSIDEFKIDCTNTDIRFTNVQFGTLNMDVTNCDIEIENCTAESVSVRTTNAEIDVNNCKISQLRVDSTNLDVTTKDCEFMSVALDGTNVDCDITRTALDKLSLKATNLDADLTIAGEESEYTVKTNGRRMPANRTGTTDKLIELSGTNNDVNLKFV